jgi:hypothetical protein
VYPKSTADTLSRDGVHWTLNLEKTKELWKATLVMKQEFVSTNLPGGYRMRVCRSLLSSVMVMLILVSYAKSALCQPKAPTPTTVVSGLSHPVHIAIDPLDNLYIADQGCAFSPPHPDCNTYKETLNGGLYSQTVLWTWTSSTNPPVGITVDTDRNVYTSIFGLGVYQQKPLAPPQTGYSAPTLVIRCPSLGQIAADNRLNLFIVDTGGTVFKEAVSQPFVDCGVGVYGNPNALVATGLNSPRFIATDGNGDVFIDNISGSQLLKETPSGTSYSQSVVATMSGLDSISGIGMNPFVVAGPGFGQVFISVGNSTTLYTETPSNAGYSQQTVSKSFLYPQGVSVDGAGNVFVVDTGSNSVVKISAPPATPPAPINLKGTPGSK